MDTNVEVMTSWIRATKFGHLSSSLSSSSARHPFTDYRGRSQGLLLPRHFFFSLLGNRQSSTQMNYLIPPGPKDKIPAKPHLSSIKAFPVSDWRIELVINKVQGLTLNRISDFAKTLSTLLVNTVLVNKIRKEEVSRMSILFCIYLCPV